MMTPDIATELAYLESLSKQGESYADETTGRYGWRNPIRSDTGALLRALVIASGARRVLEIGTAHGLSALHLICGWTRGTDVRLDTIEFDADVAEATQARMVRLDVPVRVCTGEALTVIDTLTDRYDLVFFDAQKSHYLRQLRALLDRGLVGRGTVLVADNVIDRQAECADFLQWCIDEQVPHHIVPTECGLLVGRLERP
jgi:predicted O-methyltransferase YrrM